MARTQAEVLDSQARQSPRKKKRKKRTRPVGPSSENVGLATELHDLAEDIVGEDGAAADNTLMGHTITDAMATGTMMKSEPTQKVFTETKSGFKATDKTRLAQKRAQASQAVANVTQDIAQMNTIEFALKTYRCFKTVAKFLQGVFAGIALWHIVQTYVLSNAGSVEFMKNYFMFAFPVQSLYFFLFAIAIVYALDRYDLASPTRELLVKSVSLQVGTVCVLFYFAGFILSLVMARLDERVGLLQTTSYINTTKSTPSDSDWLRQWTGLNVARGILITLGWFVVSVWPRADRLSESLLKANDDILQPNTVIRKLQATEGNDDLWSTHNTR